MLPRAVYRYYRSHWCGQDDAAARTAGVVTDTGGDYWNGRIVTDPANFFVHPLVLILANPTTVAIRSRKICCWPRQAGEGIRGDGDSSVCKGCGGYASGLETLVGPKGVRLSGGNCSGRQQRMFVPTGIARF